MRPSNLIHKRTLIPRLTLSLNPNLILRLTLSLTRLNPNLILKLTLNPIHHLTRRLKRRRTKIKRKSAKANPQKSLSTMAQQERLD
jgi:hypothetical protein